MIAQVQTKSTNVALHSPGKHVNVGEIITFATELLKAQVPMTELVTFAYSGNHLVGIEVSHTTVIETPAENVEDVEAPA